MPSISLRTIREEHASLSAVLHSLRLMLDQGPGDEPAAFFDVMRAMLFYIDEFPERRHHRNESRHLFPLLLQGAPELRPVIEKLETDHHHGERRVRALQHLLTAWELIGETRRSAFVDAVREYSRFYLDHMRVEETELLPVAQRLVQADERAALDAVFVAERDPLAGGERDPAYDELFSRIVQMAPAPIGVGED